MSLLGHFNLPATDFDEHVHVIARQSPVKALRFRTPYEAIGELWKSKPDIFIVKRTHHMLGSNT